MRAHRIESKQIEYVSPGIPRGMITVVSGRPGEGKSTWACELVARVSQTSAVILSNHEDAHAETVRPRLEAAGAELRRVFIPELPFILPNDIDELERLITRSGATLFVADSANQHLGPSASNGQAIRKALTPLKAMLERTGCACVFIDHLVKKTKVSANPLEALAGAGSGLPAAARFVYVFGRTADDPDLRVLAPVKVNAADVTYSFGYAMTGAAVFTLDGTEIDVGRLELVDDECTIDASQVIAFNGGGKASDGNVAKSAIASEWLVGVLMFGPKDAKDVQSQADGAGFSWRTVQRAAERAEVTRKREGFGKGSKVSWKLPDTHPAIAIAAAMGPARA